MLVSAFTPLEQAHSRAMLNMTQLDPNPMTSVRLLAYQLPDADIAATPEGLRKKLLVKGYVQQITTYPRPSFLVLTNKAMLM